MTIDRKVTAEYLDGIKEGRRWLSRHGMDGAQANLDNLNRTLKLFGGSHPVGQMLKGERDFWRNQIAKA